MASVTAYDGLNKNNKKLFKEMIKLYDQKMFKKAMKNWERILDSEPNHGETISMKALIYNTVGRKNLAQETIKKGLMWNFKSFTSWHIMGMINRSNNNYADAKKSFSLSAKYDESNIKIIRDLLLLEMHAGDYEAASKSITRLMATQSRNKVYCSTYMLMHHLNGDYEKAENFIEQNRDFMLSKQSKVEINEFYIYEAIIYKDHGKYDKAISVLVNNDDKIVDKTWRLEMLAELRSLKGDLEESKNLYEQLLERNPSWTKYYHGLFKSEGIDLDNLDQAGEQKICQIIQEYITKHPNLLFLKRFLLNYLSQEEEFRNQFEGYTKYMLEKGIPSLVYDIENMISNNKMKFSIVKSTFEKFLFSIQEDSTRNCLIIDGLEQDPMQECFLLYFSSQIIHLEGDYIKALEMVKQAIEHTPTFFELWQFKAKVMESLGNKIGAEVAYKQAMNLDTADRFLNAECAKYVLRNGKQEEADAIMKRWSEDSTSGQISSYEYQNMWYEIESARCQYSSGNYLEAFKFYSYIEKHIETMSQDFYDFHFYTIRKFNFRSYINTLKMQESIRRNQHVLRGTIGMLKLLDKFYQKANSQNEEEKKQFHKWLKEEAEKHPGRNENEGDWMEYVPNTNPLNKDEDPTCAKALKKIVDNGIALEASQRVAQALKFNPNDILLHYHSVKWNLRSKRFDEAIESLNHLNENYPSCPKTIYVNTIFKLYFDDEEIRSKLKEKQLASITQTIEKLIPWSGTKEYFETRTRDKYSKSLYENALTHQKYYVQGISKLFKESIVKDHFSNVFSILLEAAANGEKKGILNQLEDAQKLVKLAPQEVKEELVNHFDKVFYQFKRLYSGDHD